ncbi:MAG TPA: hypothetical protein VH024_09855 [Candidatus Angelobacter sp.]|jgi:hypothetical protein|nr:hypothetical protein [Candidatus Angelobacter sp.]
MANTLYVVLHGLICLVDAGPTASDDQRFMAYVLDQGSQHKYMFGDFFVEQDLTAPVGSPINLHFSKEVVPGSNKALTLDASVNPVVKLAQLPQDLSHVRAVITLPLPKAIHDNFLRGIIAPGSLSGTGRLKAVPTQISAVRVFEYDFGDPANLFLADDQTPANVLWKCPSADLLAEIRHNVKIAVFHLYNEPPQTLANPDTHNENEFNDSMDFLGASQVRLSKAAAVDDTQVPDIVSGVTGMDVAALDVRNQKGAIKLMRNLREAAFSADPLGGAGGTQVCGGGNGSVS